MIIWDLLTVNRSESHMTVIHLCFDLFSV